MKLLKAFVRTERADAVVRELEVTKRLESRCREKTILEQVNQEG